ncbi:protein FAR1-RELATED SEQUENCE 5-like [Lathyrus oleraceus]|uniref:protein FAR1-RELATED SEQUENCE 5-like n=1 Tax=Pisum sativum TaxID=3888 RepID=UPI0021D2990F|nr:protein FAR1-RELATED SEQUENCE 5-like [Pisum sativum]
MEASKLGFGVAIGRFDNCSDRRCTFVTMICERNGKYRTPLWNIKRDDTGYRKCEYFIQVGHPSVCRLMPEEKECVADMTLNLVQPKNIVATLKWKRPENISNIKQVYNIWYLTNKLDDNNYMSMYRTCEDVVTVRDIFWTHPNSIKLFNMFPTVLILDSTYKTNKYRLTLLEMVGVTSTEKTYSVGFAFLECKKEDNFTWALEVCWTLLNDQGDIPKAFVTDRDAVLMNLVANVFPYSNALLCRYHITKNVRSRVKPAIGTN